MATFHTAPGRIFSCLLLSSLLLITTLVNAAADNTLSARDIMAQVDARDEGENSVATSAMILIDSRNRQRVRQLKQYAKDDGNKQKYMAHFLSPADLKDTVYINYDWKASTNVDDESWLFLPALNKVKRISSEDRSAAFLGSDFSYADISGFELDWYDYQIINDSEIVDGHDCWVIEYQPKAELRDKVLRTTGDIKTQTWVRKDIFFQVKSKIWRARAGEIKYFMATDVAQIDGIWTAQKMQMITTKNDKRLHSSLFLIQDINYGVGVGDDIFIPDNMQRAAAMN